MTDYPRQINVILGKPYWGDKRLWFWEDDDTKMFKQNLSLQELLVKLDIAKSKSDARRITDKNLEWGWNEIVLGQKHFFILNCKPEFFKRWTYNIKISLGL